jgi:energy-coupling factor transporter transmembrane protein EcfT
MIARAAPRPSPLVEGSFLRRVDPRAKLALALLVSFALMLRLPALLLFALAYALLVYAGGIAPQVRTQIRRVRWLLVLVFAVDWWLVGPVLAVEVTLRLAMLVSAFQLVMATTTPDELHRAFERLGLPESVALSLGVAQRTLSDLEIEWRRILEAQRARGLDFGGGPRPHRLSRWWSQSLALAVPAIVLATKRAWSVHEAAAVRGFGSPQRRVDREPLASRDRLLLAVSLCVFGLLALWR